MKLRANPKRTTPRPGAAPPARSNPRARTAPVDELAEGPARSNTPRPAHAPLPQAPLGFSEAPRAWAPIFDDALAASHARRPLDARQTAELRVALEHASDSICRELAARLTPPWPDATRHQLATALVEGGKASVVIVQAPGVAGVRVAAGQRVPAPRDVLGFPGAKPAKPKTPVQGGGALRRRWVDLSGNLLEWGSQHGAVERYDRRGRHLGEFNPVTGDQTKPAEPSRRISP